MHPVAFLFITVFHVSRLNGKLHSTAMMTNDEYQHPALNWKSLLAVSNCFFLLKALWDGENVIECGFGRSVGGSSGEWVVGARAVHGGGVH
jgi:hypothetical protein